MQATATMIDTYLREVVRREASDLHLKPMRPPLLRLNGELVALDEEPLAPDALAKMLDEIIPKRLLRRMEEHMAVEFGYGLAGLSRFRVAVFHQRGTRAAVFRRVPIEFPSLADWGLPPILGELCKLPQGLVLITGPTGSGKSSTLAAMMHLISITQLVHIVTIEDPIEFLLKDHLAAVTQREVGNDTPSFSVALRNALRQDPDVLMVGEMRDQETIQTVLTAAETGHLVFSTLHTNGAVQTIDRILDCFHEGSQQQVRQQLASVLEGVVSLRLVPRTGGEGLVAAVEILRRTPRAAKLIQMGKLETLEEEIESSVTYHKMQSLNQSLAALVLNGAISRETALATSSNPGDLDLILRKLLYAVNPGTQAEGETMPECLSDFSKILELQEIKKLYDDLQERHSQELAERDQIIGDLRHELTRQEARPSESDQLDPLRKENERLAKQVQLIRSEYEAKMERMNERLRELLTNVNRAGATEAEKKGFFRR